MRGSGSLIRCARLFGVPLLGHLTLTAGITTTASRLGGTVRTNDDGESGSVALYWDFENLHAGLMKAKYGEGAEMSGTQRKPSSTPRSWVRTNGQKADARINSARCWWRYAPSMACSRTWQCVRFDRENRTLLGRAGRPASSRGRGKQLAWCKPCAYLTQAESGRFAL